MGITPIIAATVGAVGSISAAHQQAKAAKSIAANQLAAGQAGSKLLQPYANEGKVGLNALNQNMNYLTTPYSPTQAQLEATPGYQFTLNQGLQSTQNAAAARGLGISGAALKGAAGYATGLANSTYATNADIYQRNQGQIGGFLTGVVGAGQNAAAGQGNLMTGQANAAGQTQMAGATAAASGISGAATAINNGFSNLYQQNLINKMMAQNGAGGNGNGIASIANNMKWGFS